MGTLPRPRLCFPAGSARPSFSGATYICKLLSLSLSLSLRNSTLTKFPSIIVTLVRDLGHDHSAVSTSASRNVIHANLQISIDTIGYRIFWPSPRRSGPRDDNRCCSVMSPPAAPSDERNSSTSGLHSNSLSCESCRRYLEIEPALWFLSRLPADPSPELRRKIKWLVTISLQILGHIKH
jgi:hypothetical protein